MFFRKKPEEKIIERGIKNMKLYGIKDTVKGKIPSIYVANNDIEAKRLFEALVNDDNIEIGKFHGDMELYALGEYNEYNGAIDSKVDYLCNGTDCRKV